MHTRSLKWHSFEINLSVCTKWISLLRGVTSPCMRLKLQLRQLLLNIVYLSL
jgi:hypothetical protein